MSRDVEVRPLIRSDTFRRTTVVGGPSKGRASQHEYAAGI
jgi:hypothetical protein